MCPARGGDLICSKCCGTKRGVSIQCPSDCTYLHGADPKWHSDATQKQDARFISRFLGLSEQQIVFVLFAHNALLTARTRYGAVSDEELTEILAAVNKTLSTRMKGIVYNHPSSSPHLDRQVEWLVRLVIERKSLDSVPDASDSDVARVLTTLDKAVREHIADARAKGSYLDVAQKVLRSSLDNAPPIEVPGDDPKSSSTDLIVPP